jgi:hypothetical protein
MILMTDDDESDDNGKHFLVFPKKKKIHDTEFVKA